MKKGTQKNVFAILVVALVIAAIGIAGCTSTTDQPASTPEPTASTTSVPTLDKPESIPVATSEPTVNPTATETVKETITDTGAVKTIVIEGDGTELTIVLNRLTKEATAAYSQITVPLNSEDIFIPMMVGALQAVLFDEEEFKKMVAEGSIDEDGWVFDGYTVTKLTIPFVEEGTNTPISDYVITGPTENDIVVTKRR